VKATNLCKLLYHTLAVGEILSWQNTRLHCYCNKKLQCLQWYHYLASSNKYC